MARFRFLFVAASAFALAGCSSSPHAPDEKYFLVSTNIKVPYWQQAFAGLSRAATQVGVRAEQIGPDTYDPKGELERFRDAVRQKPAGILVSPSDPNLLKGEIDAAIGQGVPVITIDSDAPDSKRLTFIGTDNYTVGTMGGRLVASKLQGKGNIVIYTMPEQTNLKERLHGYTDVFGDHPQIKTTVIDIKGDPRIVFDRTTEMLEKKANVDGFVCLVSIAGPEVAEVLSRANATGKVVMAMDTDQRTLEGIQKGQISATIAQKPFTMAYLGLKMLDDLHHHPLPSLTSNWAQDSFSPLPTFIDTGVTLIDKSNVDSFLQARTSATSGKK